MITIWNWLKAFCSIEHTINNMNILYYRGSDHFEEILHALNCKKAYELYEAKSKEMQKRSKN